MEINEDACLGSTTEVGSYKDGASPYGALDMGGNVWEWMVDWYDEDYFSVSPDSNPQRPSIGEYRVLRGGSWNMNFNNAHTTSRFRYDPVVKYKDIGFRCAESADP